MAVKKTKSRAASSKNIEDHILGETGATVHNSFDSSTKDVHYDVKQGEVHSDTKLEDDVGDGKAIIIRSFDFRANPSAFKERTPSKQELFNAHALQIEAMLDGDNLMVMPDVKPQLVLSKQRNGYRIIVGAEPKVGQSISLRDHDKFQTLSQAAHGRFNNS